MRLPITGEYPPDWKEISARVKAEADWRCIRCGHGDDRPGEASPCTAHCTHPDNGKQRMLTVHHLDGDKGNCRWWNLLALCQACHLSVQARVIPERAWLWEHSDWFKPYVAGYYAWAIGGLELTRLQVVNRLEELLLVGQPWRTPDQG